MSKKEIAKRIKDGMITGVCSAVAGVLAIKLCEITDGISDQIVEKFDTPKEHKTLEEVFFEG